MSRSVPGDPEQLEVAKDAQAEDSSIMSFFKTLVSNCSPFLFYSYVLLQESFASSKNDTDMKGMVLNGVSS